MSDKLDDPRDVMQAEHDARLSEHPAFQAPAAMPGEEIRRIIDEALCQPDTVAFAVASLEALFAPILAEKEREIERLSVERDDARSFINDLIHMQSGAGWTCAVVREAAAAFLDVRGLNPTAHGDTSPAFIMRAEAEARALAAEAALAAERERFEGSVRKAVETIGGHLFDALVEKGVATNLIADATEAAAIRAQGE